MSLYQGRALSTESRRARGPMHRLRRWLQLVGAVLVAVGLTRLPWEGLRSRFAVLTDVRVQGAHYLDTGRVAEIAGLERGQDLLSIDCARARQALLLHPRIERARVRRTWPRGIRIDIVERVPALLVGRKLPSELDSAGVLLPPLSAGAMADVPLLAGLSLDGVPAGAQIGVSKVKRGLAWVRALSATELRLAGEVSEIDVSDSLLTALHLMAGTRVLASAWPPGTRELSALRVVLADLEQSGTLAREVDLRFRDQVIVRPAEVVGAAWGSPEGRTPD